MRLVLPAPGVARELLYLGMVVTRTLSWVGFLLAAATASLGACGRASSHGKNLGEAAGGESAGNTAGAAGNSDEPEAVTDVPLTPGSCGVVRRIHVPRGLDSVEVVRHGSGFRLGPVTLGANAELLEGELFEDSGRRWRTITASGALNTLSFPIMFGDGPRLAQVSVGAPDTSGEGDFSLLTWNDGDTTPARSAPLLRAYWRGTDTVWLRPNLDGQRAVFVIWPTAISEPRAALIGTDGRVGGVISLAANDHRFSSCQQLTPTAHGGVVSFVDTADDTWYTFDIGKTGAAPQVSLPWPSNLRCPLLSVDETGISYLISPVEPGSASQLTHASSSGEPSSEQLSLRGSPVAFTSTPRGALVLEYVDNHAALELAAPEGTQFFSLEGELDIAQPLASEPGRIFVDDQEHQAGTRDIVELGCQ